MHNFYCMFSKGFVNLSDYLYLYRSYPNSYGVSSSMSSRKDANRIQVEFMRKNLKPEIFKTVIDTGMYETRGVILTQIILWIMRWIPKCIRVKFYDW